MLNAVGLVLQYDIISGSTVLRIPRMTSMLLQAGNYKLH